MRHVKWNKSSCYNVFLLIIIVTASFLRLWRLGSVPFMHDEVSALTRTGYDNLHDLLRDGVMLNDMHPAGVQLFLYFWVRIFGWNELWLKLPFAIMGVASVYLTYVVAARWFNKNVGLVSAALLSVGQLFILYSQLIRPYTPGLFFILLMTCLWNRIFLDERKPGFWVYAGFALSAFCAAQIQMFSMAQAGIIALTGLFFFKNIDKERKKAYLWSCAAAVILYLPTFPIFYHQLFVEGTIGGWLTKPQVSFLTSFLTYMLNNSDLFVFSAMILVIMPFIIGKRNENQRVDLFVISLLWFLIPFCVAFFYSLLKSPILQYSTLIFSAPFLIIAAFSFYDAKTSPMTMGIVILMILLIGVVSLVVDRQYYKRVYKQGYDQLAVEMKQDKERYGDSICFVSYASQTFMNVFYQEKTGVSEVKNYGHDDKEKDYYQYLKNCDKDYIGVGLADHANMQWELMAVAEYPYLVHENTWFTTRYLTLTKHDNGHPLRRILDSNVDVHGEEWVCTHEIHDSLISQHYDYLFERLGFIADIQAVDTIKNIALVVTAVNPLTNETLFWRAYEDKGHMLLPGEKAVMTCGLFFPEVRLEHGGFIIKAFVWNIGKKDLIINELSYYKVKKNQFFYGLYNPI